jgi:hypothetical protein
LALLLWAAAATAPAYSADRQQRFVIEHVTDANSGRSQWSVLNDKVPLPYAYRDVGKWQWAKLPYATTERWLAPAAATEGLEAPAVQPVSVVRNGAERTITLRLRTNSAERLSLIAPADARIRAAGASGFVRPIDEAAGNGTYSLSCSGRTCNGLEVVIVQGKIEPAVFTLVGARSGLPPSAQTLIGARPNFARPQYAPDQSVIFTRIRL